MRELILATMMTIFSCASPETRQPVMQMNRDTSITPLMEAAAKGNAAPVQELLAAGGDNNRVDKPGETAIYKACAASQTEAVKLLIAAKANINISTTYRNETPLVAAAYKSNDDILTMLIKAKARLNDRHDKGRTALFQASEAEHIEVVKILIKARANLNLEGRAEHTALSFARNDEIRRLLRAAKVKQ